MKKISLLLLLPLLIPLVDATDLQYGTTLVKAGEKAPDFTAHTLDGKVIRLSQLKGKVVLVNFFTTWCGPCVREMMQLEKQIWQPCKEKGLVILAVGREEEYDKLISFRDAHNFTFSIVPDADRKIFSKYATQYIPRNFLIDRDGRVIYTTVGYTRDGFSALLDHVRKALGE